jgi:predicted phosphodiesterase
MRTLLVSDLHLGTRAATNVLESPTARERLRDAAADADRVVLLGDALELRERPLAEALEAAAPFLEELGDAIGDREIVLVPGNHDHQLAAPILEPRRLKASRPLEPEQVTGPGRTGPLAALARRVGGAKLTLAYPGLWVAPGVYATHGHYLDCHLSLPTFEALAASAMRRLTGAMPAGRLTPDEYETALSPIYAFLFAIAQGRRGPPGAGSNVKVWDRLNGGGRRDLRTRALNGLLVPGTVAVLNRVGLGPFGSDLSGVEVRRASLRAMAEVASRLEIEAEHVIFGHTHRPGPLPGDDIGDWSAPGGPRLVNTGGWVYQPRLLGTRGRQSPYWPGTCVIVEDGRAPIVQRLLDDVLAHELTADRA